MTATAPLLRETGVLVRRLRRRDRAVLLGYALSGFAIIVAGELAAFHFGLAQQVGPGPVVARGVAYLTATMGLWSMLLRGNRRLVANLLDELQNGYESILRAYDGAISLKDTYTGGHGRRVSVWAERIAAALGQAPAQVQEVREAALLHDLGKIGVADAILKKPAGLDAEELEAMREHPLAGARILEAIPALSHHAAAVRHHHERYDGAGYPASLAGEAIPLQARIIAVADVWDALTSDRSYRGALPADAAMAEIISLSGTQLDPRVVAALRRSLAADHTEGCAAHG